MDAIAVVDDRTEQRSTVVKYIIRGLKSLEVDWSVIGIPPLEDIEDYAGWISENDVRVLVLDEKLSEEMTGDVAVDYSGHDVAIKLRKQIPDLPQLIITAVVDSDDFADSAELDGAGELDAVVGRNEFITHSATHVERMVRMGMTYVSRHEADLAEMTRISEKLIKGSLTEDDRVRLDALRQKTQSTASAIDGNGIKEWLDEAKQVQSRLEEFLAEIQNKNQP